ncbi:MAG: T9SS type A sorting domain-containing protein, partial [Prevotella sp.]|nr:T9SS type A sorting domain-containing protein [Prevotella sp.]
DRIHGGFYSGFSDGYGFGSEEIRPGETVTSVLTIYDKPQAPLLIQELGSLIYSNSNKALSANGKLIATLYKIKDDGTLDEVISSDVYNDELILFEEGVWYTPFHFTEIDEQTGLQSDISLLVDYPFAIRIAWDDSSADLGFFMSQNTYDSGSAFASTNQGNNYRYGRWNADQTIFYNMYDVAFYLRGTYPTFDVYDITKQVVVPTSGGPATFTYEGQSYGNIIIESTLGLEDVEIIELPDWLDISGEEVWDTGTSEDYYTNTIYIYLEGEALPANLTGRAGNVVLSSHGINTTIQVKQGDADYLTGISAVKTESATVSRQGDNFVLSYPASATSVAVYNVAGQKVADYQLNANGTYTLPAANWAQGVYILKFNGSNTTVKVIK